MNPRLTRNQLVRRGANHLARLTKDLAVGAPTTGVVGWRGPGQVATGLHT